jgi:hypothetical protein
VNASSKKLKVYSLAGLALETQAAPDRDKCYSDPDYADYESHDYVDPDYVEVLNQLRLLNEVIESHDDSFWLLRLLYQS